MAENPERHYNITTLNFLFAMAALLLLGALVLMFAYDYSRGWKKYQRDFRDLEVEKTRVRYDLEMSALKEKSEYQELLKQIESITKETAQRSSDIKKLEAESERIQSQYDIENQQSQFAKAQYDAARYHYEEALSHRKPEAAKIQKDLEQLEQNINNLRLTLEKFQTQQNDIQNKILKFTSRLKSLQKDLKPLTKQIEIYERKLKRIDWDQMSLANRFGDMIRNLPVVDFANPNYKIRQIVLSDIRDDVNFMKVSKVDRCTTCHLGIDNPDYQDAPQPLTTHPRLELFLGNNSPHPLEEFGCTTCHEGRGRATNFVSAVHTPSSEEEKKKWRQKYSWKEDHEWEHPMYPTQFTEASCFKCHSSQTMIKGAEQLNLGMNLMERAGCFSCHTIEKYKDWPKTGPDLTKIASKTSKDWAARWIADPPSFRHSTWMPSYFGQSNNRDPQSQKRSQQEVQAIVAYLFAKSAAFNLEEVPQNGDPKKGEELVASLGCYACHLMEPHSTSEKRTRETLYREQGPTLTGLGSKTTKEWLTHWLKDPNRYHPNTKMPSLRLSNEEASDIAAFLVSDKNIPFMKNSVPKVDKKILDDIAGEFLKKSVSLVDTKDRLSKMSTDEKLIYSGEKLIRYYGCFACHNISGFEKDKPIGAELTEEGSKDVHRFDFGFVDIEHSKQAWFMQKLKDPRIFDHNLVKEPYDKLRMPNFHLTEEEAQAITTVLLGFAKDRPEPSKLEPRTARNQAIEEGQKLIRQFNCQGCHLMEGESAAIQPTVTDWLIKFKNYSEGEAKSVSTSFSPPNLIGEGKKVQTEWLFEFLHRPETIRPWLSVRMPTYHFNAAQLNTLLKYFSALDNEEFPFSEMAPKPMTPQEMEASQKLFSNEYFGCAQCHIVGNKMPAGSPDNWAPDFALAKKRLKPKWIIEWLHDPQALLPGTKMPTYFDPQNFASSGPEDVLGGDEEKQIKVLRDYLLTLSNSPETRQKPTSLAPSVPEVSEKQPQPETPAPADPSLQK